MRSDREKLLPWLIQRIDSGEVPGLYWWNKDKTEFRVIWKHAGKPDFNLDQDAVLFRMWAEHTGKYKPGEQPDPSTWKTRFRCALRKQPDIVEIPIANSLDETEPYRVFRIKNTVIRSSRTSRTSSVSPANTPSPSPDDVMEMYSYNFTPYPYVNDIGGPMTGYNPDYDLPFPSPDSSPTSSPRGTTEINDQTMDFDVNDLDNITPTLPPLYSSSGSDVNMPFSQSNSQMMQTDSNCMTDHSIGYGEPIRSDYHGYRGHVTYDMFDGVTPETQQNSFGIQDQNGMAAQLGFLMAMFGPSLIQEMLAQQTPVNVASTTTQAYRDIGSLNTMPNPGI